MQIALTAAANAAEFGCQIESLDSGRLDGVRCHEASCSSRTDNRVTQACTSTQSVPLDEP
jgi:hypothetical protein